MLKIALAALMAQGAQSPEWTHLPNGPWSAWLETRGGRLRFELELGVDANTATTAAVLNDQERLPVTRVSWSRDKRELVLDFDPYDSRITATAAEDGVSLEGLWRKRRGPDKWTELRFGASAVRPTEHDDDRVPVDSRLNAACGEIQPANGGFFGSWAVSFASDPTPAVATFDPVYVSCGFPVAPSKRFAGTILTTLGDYRYLSGRFAFESEQIEFSCFDGAHAFLFKAQLLEDGSLAGDFWSGDSWHDTWTAVRDDDAALPDPFGLTTTREGVKLDELAFPDLDGVVRKLGDAQFAGKARVVQLFGTWCPNCNDETRYLAELHERYGARGLSILGLAFELTGDFARDAGQVRKYAAHHQIRYPLLVAGVSDKQKASERFPLLDKVRAYPTTLFVDSKGVVRAVHQGFSGPATGSAHKKLREDFERLIETLLAEAK